jgi:hypothetical protein
VIGSPEVRVAGYGGGRSQVSDDGGEDISWVVLCFERAGADLLLMGAVENKCLSTAGQRFVWRAVGEFMESWAMFRGEGSSWGGTRRGVVGASGRLSAFFAG